MEQTLEAGDLVQIRDGFNRPPIYPYDEYGIFIKWGSAEKYGAKYKVAYILIEGLLQAFDYPYWEIEKVDKDQQLIK
tara:strand:- start:907 stop:1137 length:231 start_codon:yes stop_codon:yes gene_type:complete